MEVIPQQEGNSNPQYNIEYCNDAIISGESYQLGIFRFNMRNDNMRTSIKLDHSFNAQLTGQLLEHGRYLITTSDKSGKIEKLTIIGPEVLPSVDANGMPTHVTVNFRSYL